MRLSSLKIFAIKLALFSSILLYLAIDLLLWHGPVWNAVYKDGTTAHKKQTVAEVYGEEITAEQLQRYESEQNILAGRSQSDPRRRAMMIMDLVRSALLRIRTRYNDKNLPNFQAEAKSEVARLASRAPRQEDFLQWLSSQGYTQQTFTDRMEARLRSFAMLERAIAPYIEVDDTEVHRVYEQIKNELQQPASRKVSHIFLATQNQDSNQVRSKAEELRARILSGEDFATLAREYSEDERSSRQGGDLGDVIDNEHRVLPELPLFGQDAVPTDQPTLARSKWGWHILLAGEISPARQSTEEEVRESIRTAILSTRREQAVNAYFSAAVQEGFHKKRIKIHVK